MSWQNIDLFELEATWFSEELHKVILILFEQATENLSRWEEERRALLKKMLLEAKDDVAEQQTAHALADLEYGHNMQRDQVLGAAALHYLYSALKGRLKELRRYFDRSHPRAPEGYRGKSEFDRLRNEYSERFGIKFEKSHRFDNITELVLARNAGIHLGVDTMTEYRGRVKSPRFCKGDEFQVPRQAFLEILNETDNFFAWVVDSLIPIRREAVSVKEPQAHSD